MSAPDLVWYLSFLSFPAVGAVIAWHLPTLAIGWVFLGVGLTQTLAGVAGLLSDLAPAAGATAAWWSLVAEVAFGVTWVLATAIAPLVFPLEGVPVRGRRFLLAAAAVGLVIVVVGVAVSEGPLGGGTGPPSPLAVEGIGTWPRFLADVAVYALLLVTLAAMARLVMAWRRSTGRQRARLMWLAFGVLTALLVMVAASALQSWLPGWVGSTAEGIAVAVIPASVGVAILAAGLFDIGSVLSATVVYALLTGAVVLTYFAALSSATALLGQDAGRGASLLASAAIAIFLTPLKGRLHRMVVRAVYGRRDEPSAVLSELVARLEHTTALADLVETVRVAVRKALRLAEVDIVLGADAGFSEGADVVPLTAHGRREGALVLRRRAGQAPFGAAEQRLLGDLATQVAREIRAARISVDLQASREQLVHAREAERLRVRRELHDGVGPTLAAVRLQVDVLRERWAPEEPRALALLDSVRAEVAPCVADVRHIVDGLRPAALDDLGLVGVVRERIDTLRVAGLDAALVCPQPLDLGSAAVEVAAYRIVSESLANVVKHSQAKGCTVTLAEDGSWLTVSISDDGSGIRAVGEGVGLASMRDRAAELGGTLTVSSAHGRGTRVVARLPVAGGDA
ncbi:hypothetical protein GCM10025789_25900 [Tessaracoccus lubricantis]|uniref:Oxygen sensor histidine kinase NreB n=1 Tax=Tessaracoccus lubricantis TaxID=545543 RepID=A0ABP9FRH3_9ACTN